MSKIYLPSQNPNQWAQLLAEPEKQWKQGYSARALAHSWQEADGFPPEVKTVLLATPEFSNLELLLAIPEHRVPLPGGSRPSQSDIWALARAGGNLVSIAVEGKVSEPFGPTLREWLAGASPGKLERLKFIYTQLGLIASPPDGLRYQLFHRAASAIIEAKRFNAAHAIMLIHSFSQTDEWFEDYQAFIAIFGGLALVNRIVSIPLRSEISLHFVWVRGDAKFLIK